MKLLPLQLLGAVALVIAVPALQAVSSAAINIHTRASHNEHKIVAALDEAEPMDRNSAPGPNTPLLFNITVDLDYDSTPPTMGWNKDPTPGFWDFDITLTETRNGPKLHCQAQVQTRQGDYTVDFEGTDDFI